MIHFAKPRTIRDDMLIVSTFPDTIITLLRETNSHHKLLIVDPEGPITHILMEVPLHTYLWRSYYTHTYGGLLHTHTLMEVLLHTHIYLCDITNIHVQYIMSS